MLGSLECQIPPAMLGFPLTAHITIRVTQRQLDQVAAVLASIPEVLQVHGISGEIELLAHVAADADDLYRIAGRVLAIRGVERTNTALVMRELVNYRITPFAAPLRRPCAIARGTAGRLSTEPVATGETVGPADAKPPL